MDDSERRGHAQRAPQGAGPPAGQRSYLLRLWRAGEGGWRASLLSIPAGERHMFADLESLLAFLSGRPPAPHEPGLGDDSDAPQG